MSIDTENQQTMSKSTRGMGNVLGFHLQCRENPYLYHLPGESEQRSRRLK